ncbi:hypothetical protein [Ectopseudomonas khazarica]|uniref:hypothetical protein n=1 Tax=Ectopseudomonas khazarica TaxID=2502979 RepID=UPI003B951A89
MEDVEKGWLWIRELKNTVCFYRVVFGEKRERVLAVPYTEVMARQPEIRNHFKSPKNTAKLLKYLNTFEFRNKEKLVDKKVYLTPAQIIESLVQIEESLAELVKADPKCEKPENRQAGYETWRQWSKIRPYLNTLGGWNIKESDSQKALGWGTAGRRVQNGQKA